MFTNITMNISVLFYIIFKRHDRDKPLLAIMENRILFSKKSSTEVRGIFCLGVAVSPVKVCGIIP